MLCLEWIGNEGKLAARREGGFRRECVVGGNATGVSKLDMFESSAAEYQDNSFGSLKMISWGLVLQDTGHMFCSKLKKIFFGLF